MISSRDCVGGASRSAKAASGIEIALDGLGERFDRHRKRPEDGKTPRIFSWSNWVRKFYSHHGISTRNRTQLKSFRRADTGFPSSQTETLDRSGFRAAEFFSGIGLVRLALEKQGRQVVFANDIDPDKAKMYRRNWPQDYHPVVGDIHALQQGDIPTCHLFIASFPCNDLSICGRWEGLSGKESFLCFGARGQLAARLERPPSRYGDARKCCRIPTVMAEATLNGLLALNELGYTVRAMSLTLSIGRRKSAASIRTRG